MHVAEPKQDNSGIPQGVFVKRHCFLKEDGGKFSPADFSVGNCVTIYGRVYHLLDCDEFTRSFFSNDLGAEQAPALPYPQDPLTASQQLSPAKSSRCLDLSGYIEATLGRVYDDAKRKQYLENNRKVLRFWCVWDDRTGLYGDRRPYVLHYFLEDDTIEILEVNENNSGRDPFPVFLKRGLLPKRKQKTGFGVTFRQNKDKCYNPADFRLGSYIEVLGRNFFLHDCDGFTREWYMNNMGYAEGQLVAVDISEPIVPPPKPAMPFYNGYGTLDDSLQNCLSLMPKPPKRDMHKLMNKDKIVLRFACCMVETSRFQLGSSDVDRRFVLSYFMMDDTINIYEPPMRNSGIMGGKFLERGKVYKPDSEEIFTYQDLYVGAVLEIQKRGFELLEADEYTYTYMENNKHMFIMSDADSVFKILQSQMAGKEDAIRNAFVEVTAGTEGALSIEVIEKVLVQAGLKFTRHQVIALKRKLDKENGSPVAVCDFLKGLGVNLE